MKKLLVLSFLAIVISMASGCTSGRVALTPGPLDSYQKLGHVEGEACGSLGVAATGYYFIPMALNSRYERAYKDALSKAPGATGLVDVTVKEDWFWWLIGTARCVTVSGEAIK